MEPWAGSGALAASFLSAGIVRDSIRITDEGEPRTISVSPFLPTEMARPGVWLLNDFELRKELYRGKSSSLFKATCRQSGLTVALKLYRKKRLSVLNRYQVEREIRIHSRLDHRHIIRLYAAFEDEKHVYLVQEFADGGDLFEDLKRRKLRPSEQEVVAIVLAPFLQSLDYLHQKGIIHRDIKPENILLTQQQQLKLADFGLSIDVTAERPVTRAGTLDYMAPEVLVCPDKRRPEDNKDKLALAYTEVVDTWATGILAFEMLAGYPPFEQESRSATYEAIMYREPKFPACFSQDARQFISMALCKTASIRPTIAQLLQLPWIQAHMHAQIPRRLPQELEGEGDLSSCGSMYTSDASSSDTLPLVSDPTSKPRSSTMEGGIKPADEPPTPPRADKPARHAPPTQETSRGTSGSDTAVVIRIVPKATKPSMPSTATAAPAKEMGRASSQESCGKGSTSDGGQQGDRELSTDQAPQHGIPEVGKGDGWHTVSKSISDEAPQHSLGGADCNVGAGWQTVAEPSADKASQLSPTSGDVNRAGVWQLVMEQHQPQRTSPASALACTLALDSHALTDNGSISGSGSMFAAVPDMDIGTFAAGDLAECDNEGPSNGPALAPPVSQELQPSASAIGWHCSQSPHTPQVEAPVPRTMKGSVAARKLDFGPLDSVATREQRLSANSPQPEPSTVIDERDVSATGQLQTASTAKPGQHPSSQTPPRDPSASQVQQEETITSPSSHSQGRQCTSLPESTPLTVTNQNSSAAALSPAAAHARPPARNARDSGSTSQKLGGSGPPPPAPRKNTRGSETSDGGEHIEQPSSAAKRRSSATARSTSVTTVSTPQRLHSKTDATSRGGLIPEPSVTPAAARTLRRSSSTASAASPSVSQPHASATSASVQRVGSSAGAVPAQLQRPSSAVTDSRAVRGQRPASAHRPASSMTGQLVTAMAPASNRSMATTGIQHQTSATYRSLSRSEQQAWSVPTPSFRDNQQMFATPGSASQPEPHTQAAQTRPSALDQPTSAASSRTCREVPVAARTSTGAGRTPSSTRQRPASATAASQRPGSGTGITSSQRPGCPSRTPSTSLKRPSSATSSKQASVTDGLPGDTAGMLQDEPATGNSADSIMTGAPCPASATGVASLQRLGLAPRVASSRPGSATPAPSQALGSAGGASIRRLISGTRQPSADGSTKSTSRASPYSIPTLQWQQAGTHGLDPSVARRAPLRAPLSPYSRQLAAAAPTTNFPVSSLITSLHKTIRDGFGRADGKPPQSLPPGTAADAAALRRTKSVQDPHATATGQPGLLRHSGSVQESRSAGNSKPTGGVQRSAGEGTVVTAAPGTAAGTLVAALLEELAGSPVVGITSAAQQPPAGTSFTFPVTGRSTVLKYSSQPAAVPMPASLSLDAGAAGAPAQPCTKVSGHPHSLLVSGTGPDHTASSVDPARAPIFAVAQPVQAVPSGCEHAETECCKEPPQRYRSSPLDLEQNLLRHSRSHNNLECAQPADARRRPPRYSLSHNNLESAVQPADASRQPPRHSLSAGLEAAGGGSVKPPPAVRRDSCSSGAIISFTHQLARDDAWGAAAASFTQLLQQPSEDPYVTPPMKQKVRLLPEMGKLVPPRSVSTGRLASALPSPLPTGSDLLGNGWLSPKPSPRQDGNADTTSQTLPGPSPRQHRDITPPLLPAQAKGIGRLSPSPPPSQDGTARGSNGWPTTCLSPRLGGACLNLVSPRLLPAAAAAAPVMRHVKSLPNLTEADLLSAAKADRNDAGSNGPPQLKIEQRRVGW